MIRSSYFSTSNMPFNIVFNCAWSRTVFSLNWFSRWISFGIYLMFCVRFVCFNGQNMFMAYYSSPIQKTKVLFFPFVAFYGVCTYGVNVIHSCGTEWRSLHFSDSPNEVNLGQNLRTEFWKLQMFVYQCMLTSVSAQSMDFYWFFFILAQIRHPWSNDFLKG